MGRLILLASMMLALSLGAAQAAPHAAPGKADARKLAVAHEMVAAWHGKDWRKVADLFTQDGVLHSMMIEPITGREAIYKRVSGLGDGLDSITLDVAHMGVIDGLVFIERVDRFHYKGHDGAVPVVGVLSFKDGKIAEWREYYDRASLLHEMGVGKE